MAKAQEKNVKMHFPTDFVTGDKFDENATVSISLRIFYDLFGIFQLE